MDASVTCLYNTLLKQRTVDISKDKYIKTTHIYNSYCVHISRTRIHDTHSLLFMILWSSLSLTLLVFNDFSLTNSNIDLNLSFYAY